MTIPYQGVASREVRLPRVSIAPVAPVIAALVIWGLGLTLIDVRRMNDLGLVSVMPPHVIIAIAILTASAGFRLRSTPVDGRVMAAHLLALVFVLYAFPPIVEQVARTAVTWAHLGFAEYIARTGTTAPTLEARFNWPGFFVSAAFISRWPVVGTLTASPNGRPSTSTCCTCSPLAMIFRGHRATSGSSGRRCGCSQSTNWIGQDYFSPQALAYFLYLVILAVGHHLVPRPASEVASAIYERLRELHRAAAGGLGVRGLTPAPRTMRPRSPSPSPAGGDDRVPVVVLFAFVAYSHQLTPFFRRPRCVGSSSSTGSRLRSLPILFGVMAVAWVSYMTVPFLEGHVVSLLRRSVSSATRVGPNVTKRIAGQRRSPDRGHDPTGLHRGLCGPSPPLVRSCACGTVGAT